MNTQQGKERETVAVGNVQLLNKLAPKKLRSCRFDDGGREWQRVEILAAIAGEGDRDERGEAVVDVVDESNERGACVIIRWQAKA